jgi:hypothetical protein
MEDHYGGDSECAECLNLRAQRPLAGCAYGVRARRFVGRGVEDERCSRSVRWDRMLANFTLAKA